MKHGKLYRAADSLVDHERFYSPIEAVKLIKEFPERKFDETVEVAFRLGVDPRKADQMIRGTVTLPHGTGKSIRVARLRRRRQGHARPGRPGPTWWAARSSSNEVMAGTIDFDAAVATPDMMAAGRQGRPGARARAA